MKKQTRVLALMMAVLFALGSVAVAQAELSSGASVTLKENTYIYLAQSSGSGITMQQTTKQIAAGTQLNILGTNNGWAKIQVRDSATSAPYEAWIPETAYTTATTTGSTTGATAGTATGGTPGVIANCTTGVNFRSSASASSTRIGTLTKGSAVSVLASEKGADGETWYKVSYGTYTGYVLAKYVSTTGTVSVGAGTAGATGTATGTVTNGASGSYSKYEAPVTMVSLDRTIILRKAPDKSTSSSNVVKKLSGVKGKGFAALGESGDWYYLQYGSYQGYGRKQDFAVASGISITYADVTGGSADRWGYIKQIPGTKIGTDFNRLHDNNIYCNGLNSKGTDYYYNKYSGSKNYFFSLVPQNAETAVISGHNMQSSQTGFHDLHHVQNALLGVATCEESKCRQSCANSAATTFYINYGGKTTWQVVGFFELNQDTMASESSRKSAQSNILLGGFSLTGAKKATWLNQVLAYANSTYKGKTLSTATEADKLMVLYTCGDHGNDGARAKANGSGSSKGGYQNLYFVLKAVS